MKLSIISRINIALIAFMLMSHLLFADGVVAETNSGKLVTIEWIGHGAEFQQSLASAEMKVFAPDGKVIASESFEKSAISMYTAKKLNDSLVEIRLVIKSKDTKIDLKFRGHLADASSGPEFEMEALKKALRDPNRKPMKGSLLNVSSSSGKFQFQDVVLGIYGDL